MLLCGSGQAEQVLQQLPCGQSSEGARCTYRIGQSLAFGQVDLGPTIPSPSEVLRVERRMLILGAVRFRELALDTQWARHFTIENDVQVRRRTPETVWELLAILPEDVACSSHLIL
jgi:hypothetical protein